MQASDKNMLDASDKIAVFVEKLSLWKGDNKRVWYFSVLYFYLNKCANQTKYQVRFFHAFINYIWKTLIIFVFINILFLVRRKSSKLFRRHRNEKRLRTTAINHQKILRNMQINNNLLKSKIILTSKYKLSGSPIFTFNLPQGSICPSASPVSYATAGTASLLAKKVD